LLKYSFQINTSSVLIFLIYFSLIFVDLFVIIALLNYIFNQEIFVSKKKNDLTDAMTVCLAYAHIRIDFPLMVINMFAFPATKHSNV